MGSSFGERLHDAMVARGVGVSQLGKACGVTRQTIARWFAMEKADLSGTHLVQCCEKLHLRARWLVLGVPPMLTDAPQQERQARLSEMER